MEEMTLIEKVTHIASIIGYFLAATTVVARLVSRLLIKGTEDDKKVDKYSGYIWKVINWLPTVGINPRTKKIEEAYKDLHTPRDIKNVK